jgi:hypothetical protein
MATARPISALLSLRLWLATDNAGGFEGQSPLPIVKAASVNETAPSKRLS